ncbi:MAG: NAD(P)-dependent glycerol-3-phosphate dehydrogenase [Oscillospiraceae bacterium]|jgi:glycerol-3-phosphate dehydrogenase (NAD(P)+)|nr:NAD(P)-dependent glycerol-3-phosphate dehydrogenase [Oscillospiraceae bacterium]
MKISIFGSGAWGIAIAILLNDNGHEVTLRSSHDDVTAMLRDTRRNPHLENITIPDTIRIAETLDDATNGAEIAVMSTSSIALRDIATKLKPKLAPDCVVVIVSKGIERGTSMLFTDILRDTFGPNRKIAALSGPTHAEEVARKIPTACVVASTDADTARLVQDVFMSEYFRVYTSTDVIGVELGAALKNVIAVCAGICDGLGYGDNTIATLATRGLSEIARLSVAMGGRKETLAGLAGLGDLIVTCTSRHSRNRRAGVLIGRGVPVREAMREVGAVVEGYYAAEAARDLAARIGVDMPICLEAYNVLYEGRDARDAIRELMGRSKRSEAFEDTLDESWVQ